MHVDLKSKRGCGSCKQKRASSNLYSDFVAITAGLSSEGANRLKRYLNAPALMLNVVDVSGHVAIKTM